MDESAIKVMVENKLKEMEKNFEGLADYVVMMLRNRKEPAFVRNDLGVFLDADAEPFFMWLQEIMHTHAHILQNQTQNTAFSSLTNNLKNNHSSKLPNNMFFSPDSNFSSGSNIRQTEAILTTAHDHKRTNEDSRTEIKPFDNRKIINKDSFLKNKNFNDDSSNKVGRSNNHSENRKHSEKGINIDDEQIRQNKIRNFQKVMNAIAQNPNDSRGRNLDPSGNRTDKLTSHSKNTNRDFRETEDFTKSFDDEFSNGNFRTDKIDDFDDRIRSAGRKDRFNDRFENSPVFDNEQAGLSRNNSECLKIFSHVQNLPPTDLRHQLERNRRKKMKLDRNRLRSFESDSSDDDKFNKFEQFDEYNDDEFQNAAYGSHDGFGGNDYEDNPLMNAGGDPMENPFLNPKVYAMNNPLIDMDGSQKHFKPSPSGNQFDKKNVGFPYNTIIDPQDILNKKTRCKFWPMCQNVSCPYEHPAIECRQFPACPHGRNCMYGHPLCKFNLNCKNKMCTYYHDFQAKKKKTGGSKVAKASEIRKTVCRFGFSCSKKGCPYLHAVAPAKKPSKVADNFTPQVRTITGSPAPKNNIFFHQ